MRLLVACPQCKRQFDASGRPIGSQFRCCCGATVAIRQPRGHEATVVRCSSCGGPRKEQSTACQYCGADFTVHEQDLDTVCPGCFARVSDRAKFCHHCGLALIPEPFVSDKTPLHCPACGKLSRLSNRRINEVAVLECGRCAGFWLAAGVLGKLIEKAAHDALSVDWSSQASPRRTAVHNNARQPGPLYRQCPYCHKLMSRRNYARHSGVIVDACKYHGVWFDADELSRILEWVRSGGLAKAQKEDADEAAHKERLAEIARRGQQRGPFTRELHESDDVADPAGILAALIVKMFS